ncbi:MAG TPA: succinylglutamate desuccinylase/aspartoacylase family protein, partial [Candidatus Saccharimonadales bacterium]|nr:succinylglutamate desuccinylase/aspartoacylase family protein [Candidatus Saccharimonadales bacterium]
TESDLNRSFGETYVGTYETKRAARLKKLAASYDVVLDFHNTQTPGNNCGFVGVGCDPRLYDVAKAVGFSMCVEATYDCVNKYCLNTISIEISVGDALDDPDVWYQKITALSAGMLPVPKKPLQLYRFSRRVSWEEKAVFGLENWRPFRQISTDEARRLGVKKQTVPIFIGSRFTSEYATLLSVERSV